MKRKNRSAKQQENFTDPPHLVRGEDGLSLVAGGLSIRGDFTRLLPRIRNDRLPKELLIRAAGSSLHRILPANDADGSLHNNADGSLHNDAPLAIDATAGLGEDSFLLAAAGFRVRLYEYDPTIASLLRDALRRASECPELKEIAARMTLYEEDSMKSLPSLDEHPAVILLDPMFPEKRKDSLTRKKLQLIQKLELPCASEEELLAAAIAAKPDKIIIKRPLKGPCLAGRKPSYSIRGKTVRYDCLVFPKQLPETPSSEPELPSSD